MKSKFLLSSLTLAGLAAFGLPAQANSFECITNNGTCAEAVDAAQWSLAGSFLTLSNVAMSTGMPTITNIYFEGQDATVSTSVGTVSYTRMTTGGNLPGGNSVGFDVGTWFDATPPPTQNGVNPGESITFELVDYTGTPFRVGLHMQQLGDGGEFSESLVTTIPEPETYALMLAGLGVVGFMARRRKSV